MTRNAMFAISAVVVGLSMLNAPEASAQFRGPMIRQPMYRPASMPVYRPMPAPMYRPAPMPIYRPMPAPMYRPMQMPMYRPMPVYRPPAIQPVYRPMPNYRPNPIQAVYRQPMPMYRPTQVQPAYRSQAPVNSLPSALTQHPYSPRVRQAVINYQNALRRESQTYAANDRQLKYTGYAVKGITAVSSFALGGAPGLTMVGSFLAKKAALQTGKAAGTFLYNNWPGR